MRKFLLVGRTGVGKSSFINATFGKYLAETSDYEACTKVVERYANNTPFGNICLIDTPGFAEDDKQLDMKYMELIKSQVNFNELHAIIYVTRLDETRFRPDEKRTLMLLANQLSLSLWEQSWLVLTFAASVSPEKRRKLTSERLKQIETYLRTLTNQQGVKVFSGFKVKLRVDNVVPYQTPKTVPVLSILTR